MLPAYYFKRNCRKKNSFLKICKRIALQRCFNLFCDWKKKTWKWIEKHISANE